MPFKSVALIILDGFGVGPHHEGNAITTANTPTLKTIEAEWAFTQLSAAGIAVGLPWGEAGNSEVGHLTMGSGRVIYQSALRINYAIKDGSFFSNTALTQATNHVQQHHSKLHLVGLLTNGIVHASFEHLEALVELARRAGLTETYLHLFTDGRDSLPKSGSGLVAKLEEKLAQAGVGRIATLIGRDFAMDRDGNWDRIETTWRCLFEGRGNPAPNAQTALGAYYEKGFTDSDVPATVITAANGTPRATIGAGDAIICFNFREDSMRQIAHAIADPDFHSFDRPAVPKNLCAISMTAYETRLAMQVAFPAPIITDCLAEVVAQADKKQLRIAETEKYAHVTYFFNGMREDPFPGEERILIPSAEPVHPEENPEMHAADIAAKVIERMRARTSDLIVANFANADMVGHTGDLAATRRAVEAIDRALAQILSAADPTETALIITSDHGNAEEKLDPKTGHVKTAHTTNPVPCFLIAQGFERPKTPEQIDQAKQEVRGLLTDIAPTVLELLGLAKPEAMTGQSLLKFL
ncbi:2,3-bisphosphoglycerate-independent phosphoglycerate mutase [Candidatus Parcubacteria bacterium]|nr:2,3-bisphosphoglycerate-independent phosphoglycerate mutase [Candidatus Parcubacteria bacterium]